VRAFAHSATAIAQRAVIESDGGGIARMAGVRRCDMAIAIPTPGQDYSRPVKSKTTTIRRIIPPALIP
jgi:hypothetical protein